MQALQLQKSHNFCYPQRAACFIGGIGKAVCPVTMVNEYSGERVFYTSLGAGKDFQEENFRRLLTHAIFWTTHRGASKMKK